MKVACLAFTSNQRRKVARDVEVKFTGLTGPAFALILGKEKARPITLSELWNGKSKFILHNAGTTERT